MEQRLSSRLNRCPYQNPKPSFKRGLGLSCCPIKAVSKARECGAVLVLRTLFGRFSTLYYNSSKAPTACSRPTLPLMYYVCMDQRAVARYAGKCPQSLQGIPERECSPLNWTHRTSMQNKRASTLRQLMTVVSQGGIQILLTT